MHRRRTETDNGVNGIGIEIGVQLRSELARRLGAVDHRLEHFCTEIAKYFGHSVVGEVAAGDEHTALRHPIAERLRQRKPAVTLGRQLNCEASFFRDAFGGRSDGRNLNIAGEFRVCATQKLPASRDGSNGILTGERNPITRAQSAESFIKCGEIFRGNDVD